MNPELRRNLWIDATPRKLAFAGAILAGVFVAVWLLDRGRHAYAVTLAGAVVFSVSALGWAPRAARNAVTGEVLTGSWDFQRLTALTPWTLTWGKLAGATARPWATAAGGLLLSALQLSSTSSLRHAAFWILVAFGLAVTLQASGLATGLIDVRRARASGRPLSVRAPGLLLLVLGLLTLAVLVWVRARAGDALGRLHFGAAPGPAEAPPLSISWFGHAYAPLGFAAASLIVVAAWAVVWAWRLMRLELQWSNRPWAWAGFLAWSGLYVLGFDPGAGGVAARLAVRLAAAAGLWAALAYVAAFAGPADRVRARQFAAAVRGRRPARVLTHLPLTALPSALAFVAGGVVALIRARQGEVGSALAMLAALGFFGRDLGVIAWRRFAGRGRRGDAGVLLFLLGLYLLGGAGGWLFARARGVALFWPSPAHPRLNLLAAAAEAALAWALAAVAVSRPALPPRQWAKPSLVSPDLAHTAVPPTDTAPAPSLEKAD